jgi:hypothetical protein
LEFSSFIFILSLFFLNLLCFNFFLLIVDNSLFESKLLSLESILELIDSSLLHRISNSWIKFDWGNNTSFNLHSFISKTDGHVFFHSLSMLVSSERISFFCFDWSCHCSNSFDDIGINELIDFTNICDELLDIFVWLHDWKKNGNTNINCTIVSSQNTIDGTLINKILSGHKILSFGPW